MRLLKTGVYCIHRPWEGLFDKNRNPMKIGQYITEAIAELHQVRWPTRHQAIRLSVIVIGFTVIMASIFGFIDYALSSLVRFMLSLTY